jgi:hypothetical protein
MSVGSFLADPAFPQLKIATDPTLMKQTFRTHLHPVGGKVYDIGSAIVRILVAFCSTPCVSWSRIRGASGPCR